MQPLGLHERLRETEVIDAGSKIVGDFIAAHSTPVTLRERTLYVSVVEPALHYELEQISKPEILRKRKQRFGTKTIRDIRFRVGLIWKNLWRKQTRRRSSHLQKRKGSSSARRKLR